MLTHSIESTDNLSIEYVRIRVRITHPHSGDLGIFLSSPSGTHSLLLNPINVFSISRDRDLDMYLASEAFYGEQSQGIWSLEIRDYEQRDTGTLDSWDLEIYGH